MKRKLSFVLALLMVAALFSACGTAETGGSASISENSGVTSQTAETNPYEKETELIWYCSGNTSEDTSKVMDAFNSQLKEKCNTTIQLNYVGFNDWDNQLNLILTSGEKVDLVYVSAGSYNRYAKNGAFLDITEMFPEYMPETYAYFSEAELSSITANGTIYGIPASRHGYIPYGVMYRKDLMEKYNLQPITSLETYEKYMDTIKANETDIMPYNGNPEYGMKQLFRAIYGFEPISGSGSDLVMVKSYDDIENIIAYPFTDEYVEWSKRMKDYADRGWWSSNALSATVGTWDNIQVGTSATSIENPEGLAYLINSIGGTNPDFTFDYWGFYNLNGYVIPNVINQDGFALPKSAPNPERCLRILEEIKTDSALYDTFMYGVKGYNYELEGEKIIAPAPGTEGAVYDPASIGWAMRTEPLIRTSATEWEGFAPLMTEIKELAVDNKFGPAVLDQTEVSAELAAVTQVAQQYGTPLNIGLVEDVDAAIEQYRKALTDAGIDALVSEIKTQMLEYYTEKGIS